MAKVVDELTHEHKEKASRVTSANDGMQGRRFGFTLQKQKGLRTQKKTVQVDGKALSVALAP